MSTLPSRQTIGERERERERDGVNSFNEYVSVKSTNIGKPQFTKHILPNNSHLPDEGFDYIPTYSSCTEQFTYR